ncbi:hypothetical protein ACFXTH_040541 [Malus domestica]
MSSSQFFVPRWTRVLRRQNFQSDNIDNTHNSNNIENIINTPIISNSVESYACTQVGVPAFHSTSCDGAHQPQWEVSAGSSLIPIQSRRVSLATSQPAPSAPYLTPAASAFSAGTTRSS